MAGPAMTHTHTTPEPHIALADSDRADLLREGPRTAEPLATEISAATAERIAVRVRISFADSTDEHVSRSWSCPSLRAPVRKRSTLAEQRITTSDDACLPERDVRGPLTAYCQADVIQQHVLEATGGLPDVRRARLGPPPRDRVAGLVPPVLAVTSVLAFGVTATTMGMGVLFVLIGLAIRDVRQQVEEVAPE